MPGHVTAPIWTQTQPGTRRPAFLSRIGSLVPHRFFRRWRRPDRRALSSAGLAVTVIVLGVAALTARGIPAAEVSLNDGGVWVTSTGKGVFGRFNRPIEHLDALLSPANRTQTEFDVLQDGKTVFLVDVDGGQLRPVNVADIVIDPDGPALPAGAEAAMGGGVVAILEKATGKLWVRTASLVAGLKINEEAPTATVGGDASVTVGPDGTVHAVSSVTNGLLSIKPDGSQAKRKLPVDVVAAVVTAVGDVPVVLSQGGELVLPDEVVNLGSGAKLQQPGPSADDVVVATNRELIEVDLSSGSKKSLSSKGSGNAARPVRLGGCVHAAWGGQPASYERHCDGVAPDKPVILENLGSTPRLVFRVNRDVIVLNDAVGGAVYLFDRGGQDLGNWDDLIEQTKPSTESKNPTRPNPQENTPPRAADDRYGARPDQSAVLHVLDNDSDPDGDVLVVGSFTAVKPSGAGELVTIHNGQALQFTPAPGTRQATITFKYTIDDGRGGKATAGVTIQMRPDGNEQPDEKQPAPRLDVEQGGTVGYNVLLGWRDPDGDPLLLVEVTAPDTDTASFTPAGELTFTAAPDSPTGDKTVKYQISDGHEPVRKEGVLRVRVLPRGAAGEPTARDDLASGVAGQPITIRPLDNDYDPNTTVPGTDQRLRLSFVSPAPAGTVMTPDYVANTISFTAGKPGTFYLQYRITDGRVEKPARIRIDVRAASSAHAPVAVADQLGVRGSVPGMVDILANDVDLDGDLLAVQSITVPENSGLVVSVVEHRWLRVVASQSETGWERSTLEYVVSDGRLTDTGVVTVTRLAASNINQPPIAQPDVAVVRARDFVSIDVLANDSDPDGSTLTLDSSVVSSDSGRGDWMVAGGVLRFRAPQEPGATTANYTVRDERGASAVGQVTVTVIAATAPNQIPQPPPLSARVFSGTTVRVQIPLTGVDPDGDSVLLLGPATSPTLGRIVKQGIDFLEYEAFPDAAGTDVFTYRVVDSFGGRGTGSIRVGVVPFPQRNSAPVAVDDLYTVAPGAKIRVPVLANDSDVDGDPLRLEPLEPVNPKLPAGATIEGGRVLLTAGPNDGDVVSVRYGVSDGRGQRATASVTLTARRGANLAPIARDDLADPPPAGAASVDVDVLANDEDLDGPRSELKLEPLGVGQVTPGGSLRIPLTVAPRQIAYQIKDRQGAAAVAFVRVPGTGNMPPRLREQVPDLVVPYGGELVVDIAALVTDPEGSPVRLTTTAAISTSPPTGLSLVPGGTAETGFKVLAAQGFHGLAGAVFEVTDGTNTVSLSVPLTVAAPAGQPPVWQCPPAEPVAGGPAVTVDLPRCVRGTGPAFSFSGLSRAPAGVTAELRGTQLVISAAVDAQVGERGELSLTVTDGQGVSAGGKLGLIVRPSGLAVAVTDTYDGAHANTKISINVIANDENPFPATALKVLSVTSPAVVEPDQAHVTITPTKLGRATFTYRVQDATGRPDREVTGQIVVNVIDKPAAPGMPQIRDQGNRYVVLAWNQPQDNGAPVDYYKVTGEPGYTTQCPTTVCRLERLTNGQAYTFQVQAHNEVGDSDLSPRSAQAHPDAKPGAPSPPTTQFGDTSITVRWAPPATNGGSVVTSYEVEISPPAGSSPRPATAPTLTWTGLTNGVAYTFRVRAHNANLVSEWSGYSAPEIPAGTPAIPAAPTAAGVADGIGQQMVVNWVAPNNNGAAINQYQLMVIRAGVADRTINISGDTTTATVNVDNGVSYTFRVAAANKAGVSSPSPQSAAAVAHGKPFPVTTHSYSDNSGGTGYDGRVAYSLTAPNDNGMAIVRYEFDRDGNGSADASSTGTDGFVGGLSNGATYQIRVRACNDACGNWSSAGNSVTPYGPVPTPNAGAAQQGSQQIGVSWSSGGTNGRPLSRIEINIDGGGWQDVGTAGGSQVVGNGYNQTHGIQVRAFDTAGQVSPIASASATTQSAPAATVTVSRGSSAVGQPNCTDPSCAFIRADLANFAPNATFNCVITSDTDPPSSPLGSFTITTNGSGSGGRQSTFYYGYPNGFVTVTCNGVSGTRNPWR